MIRTTICLAVLLLVAPVARCNEPAARLDALGDPLPPGAVARLGTARLRSPCAEVKAVAFSPDGKLLATARDDQAVQIWDPANGRLLHTLKCGGYITALLFTPDGKSLVVAERDAPMSVWDVASGRLLRHIDTKTTKNVRALALSPDGKIVASGVGEKWPHDEVVRLWEFETGREVNCLGANKAGVKSLAFALEGKLLAALGHDGIVRLWDTATGSEKQQLPCPWDWERLSFLDRVRLSVVLLPDGKRLLVTGDRAFHLFEVASGKEIRHGGKDIASVAFAPDGKTFATGSSWGGGPVTVWDADTGKVKHRFSARDLAGQQVAFSPDGKTLAFTDSRPRLIDLGTGKEKWDDSGHSHTVCSLAVSADGRSLLSSGADGLVCLWDLPRSRQVARAELPRPEPYHCVSVTLSPDGRTLFATVGAPLRSRSLLWETATGRLKRDVKVQVGDDPWFAGYTPDGTAQAWWTPHSLRFVEMSSSKTFADISIPPHGANADEWDWGADSWAFSPNGATLAVGSGARNNPSGTVGLWDVKAKKLVRTLRTDRSPATCVAFSPDGALLATWGSGGDWLQLWDLASGRELWRSGKANLGSNNGNRPTVFSPDGRLVATRGEQGDILVLETASGREALKLSGHRGEVTALVFAPDGRRLYSASDDSTILAWDLGDAARARTARTSVKPWDALAGDDAVLAFNAVCSLATPEGVAQLKERLKPSELDPRRAASLIADLGSEEFETREAASKALLALRDDAAAAIREALAKSPSLEARRRLEALAEEWAKAPFTSEQLRQVRAVQVLELAGTTEARAVLEALAKGSAQARQTREATAALTRLRPRREVMAVKIAEHFEVPAIDEEK